MTYALFRDFGRDEAAKVVSLTRGKIEIVPTKDSDYLSASEFRKSTNRTGKKLSLVDALGYSCSRKLGKKFFDRRQEIFRDEKNVEYTNIT